MSDFRIEDLFEPLNKADEDPAPTSLDEATERYGFDAVYDTIRHILDEEEQR